MTVGTIGIIGCPILEDEIMYMISNDSEEKKIFLVDSHPAFSLKEKLESSGLPFTLIEEWNFETNDYNIDRSGSYNVIIMMNKLGLHSDPKYLRSTLEDQMKMYQNRFDAISLYYGMCGNGGWDVSEWAKDNLDVPVFVFRDKRGCVCDDCIGVAVGGPERYYQLVKKYAGMFFVTPAIAANWDEFAKELDFCKGFEIMDIFDVKGVFEVFGYKYAVKIDTGIGLREGFDEKCEYVADQTGLELITAEPGFTDLGPAKQLYNDTKSALEQKDSAR